MDEEPPSEIRRTYMTTLLRENRAKKNTIFYNP